jgi:hypothetical protein
MTRRVDLGDLGFDNGAHLLLQRGLSAAPPGQTVEVVGRAPALAVDLPAWCRGLGHRATRRDDTDVPTWTVEPGAAPRDRWVGAERAGAPGPDGIVASAPAHWGLAARGALVERGATTGSSVPYSPFDIRDRDLVWADIAPALYAHAAAEQWDPNTAVDWNAGIDLDPDVDRAVVQVMTYLVENEQAALVVPAKLLARIHPHFREVLQLLAVQAADEARHMEVFARRAVLTGLPMGTSTVGGRQSLATLLEEADFSMASFLLSVLGEGSFLNLLEFLDVHAPDPVTRDVTRLARRDEARHVAFGVAHLRYQADRDTDVLRRLRAAVERRYSALVDTAGLNSDVFDSLVLLAAGSWDPAAIARGYRAVLGLQDGMDQGRQRRLIHLGFPADEAADISALHTKNFM